MLNRITISTDSPNALPTTGINPDAAFIPFAASPSILLVKPPSNDNILTNIVITIPNNQVIPDFKNLDNLPICTLSDKFDIIPNAVAFRVSGKINNVIVFAINITANIIIGCIKATDVTLPCS